MSALDLVLSAVEVPRHGERHGEIAMQPGPCPYERRVQGLGSPCQVRCGFPVPKPGQAVAAPPCQVSLVEEQKRQVVAVVGGEQRVSPLQCSTGPQLIPAGVLVSALSRWARGDYAHEAAVDLLARFGCPSGFWLRRPDFLDNCVEAWVAVALDETTRASVHVVDTRIDGAALAGLLDGHHIEGAAGELRVLHLVAGLLGYPTARPLSDQLIGLDEDTTRLVLHAVAHVGGWHERGRTFDVAVRDAATTDSVDFDAGACHE